jgi:DNA-binding NarL/FixJ family response regulator
MYQPKTFSDIAERFAALSERQQQVVTLVCDGLSNKMIAQKLDVSETAIKAHLHATYEKLGVRSRFERICVLANRGKPKPD